MGVEEALQTNETVDIFQEEPLVCMFAKMVALTLRALCWTHRWVAELMNLEELGRTWKNLEKGVVAMHGDSTRILLRFAHLGEEEAGAITKTHSKLKDTNF